MGLNAVIEDGRRGFYPYCTQSCKMKWNSECKSSKINRASILVKVFRIIPEFRILRLKVSLKMLNCVCNNSFSDLVSVHLKVFDL